MFIPCDERRLKGESSILFPMLPQPQGNHNTLVPVALGFSLRNALGQTQSLISGEV